MNIFSVSWLFPLCVDFFFEGRGNARVEFVYLTVLFQRALAVPPPEQGNAEIIPGRRVARPQGDGLFERANLFVCFADLAEGHREVVVQEGVLRRIFYRRLVAPDRLLMPFEPAVCSAQLRVGVSPVGFEGDDLVKGVHLLTVHLSPLVEIGEMIPSLGVVGVPDGLLFYLLEQTVSRQDRRSEEHTSELQS